MTSRRSLLWLSFGALLLDAAALASGALLAYSLRFSAAVTPVIPIVTALPPLIWYVRLAVVFAGLVLLFNLSGGLYRFPRADAAIDELFAVGRRYIIAFTVLLAGLFFYRGASYSRLATAVLFLLGGTGLLVSRSIGRWARGWLHRRGVACRRAAIVGVGAQAREVLQRVSNRPESGIRVVGCIGPPMLGDPNVILNELENLGVISQAGRIVRERELDILLISPAAGEEDPLPALISACYGVNVEFLYLPDIEVGQALPKRVIEVGGVPLWALKEAPFAGWPGLVKRLFDLGVTGILLVLLSPFLIVLAVAVKLTSRGPIFYTQTRVGLDGRVFNCLKFRSMRLGAEAQTGPIWAKAGDSRVTPVGRLLRRWSLDELPQLWNVLRGDMSLVGPRPERPEFVQQFEQRIDGYHERHRVRAGLTGWAQVNGLRGNVPIEQRTRSDRFYVENWSLGLDLKILIMTVVAVVKGENSY